MKFNERLRELRKRSPLKQTEIATLLDIAPRTLQNYELGKREPNISTLIKMADIFDVTLDYLVGRDYPKHVTFVEED